jgi:hypothetical protein
MAISNTQTAAGIVPVSRIPLFMVESALHHAGAKSKAKTALCAVLDMVSHDDWRLRHAILDAVSDARSAQRAIQCFDRYAVGVRNA